MQNIINFNKDKFPIVIVSTEIDVLTDEQIDFYLKEMTNFYTENQGNNIVLIYDISLLKAINANGRIKVGEWLKETASIIKKAVAGVCYVQKNVFQKIILQGIFTIKTPEWEHKVVANLEAGIDWGKKILADLT